MRNLPLLLIPFLLISCFHAESPNVYIQDLSSEEENIAASVLTREGQLQQFIGADFEDIGLDQTIEIPFRIRTDQASEGSILLPDDSVIRLNSSTELEVTSFNNADDEISAVLSLVTGRIWLNVNTDLPHEYLVKTNNLEARSRASIFEVQEEAEGSRVASHRDPIEVAVKSNGEVVSQTSISSDQELEFNAQEIKNVLQEATPEEAPLLIKEVIQIQELTKEDLEDSFYLLNTELDRKSSPKEMLGSIKREVKNLFNLQPEKHKIITSKREIDLKGSLQILPPEETEIRIQEKLARLNGLDWVVSGINLVEGRNTFDVLVDGFVADRVIVIKDTISPDPVVVDYPANMSLINKRYIKIEGTYDDDAAEILVGDVSASMLNGEFQAEVELRKGKNQFVIKAIDLAKNIGPETELTIYREYRPKEEVENLPTTPTSSTKKVTPTKAAKTPKPSTTSKKVVEEKPKTPKPTSSKTSTAAKPTVTHPNGGKAFTTCDTYAILRGSVPGNTKAVYINGIAAAISGSTWSKRMNLYEGDNTFNVSAISTNNEKSSPATQVITRHDCSKSY